MKIDKEQLNKLKQLDRIEFRQKIREIEELNITLMPMVYLFFITAITFFIGTLILVSLHSEHFALLYKVTLIIIKVGIFLTCVEIILTFVNVIIYLKKKNELFNEYFKVEVKK